MIQIERNDARTLPSFEGIHADDGEWRLDPSQYRTLTESVAGIPLTEDLSATDCYRIGNRLEAFIAERRRDGEWTASLVEEYPAIESRDELVALAQFLRACHERCLDSGNRCT
jgi:hypothetical protein